MPQESSSFDRVEKPKPHARPKTSGESGTEESAKFRALNYLKRKHRATGDHEKAVSSLKEVYASRSPYRKLQVVSIPADKKEQTKVQVTEKSGSSCS
mmetsp:Transcript_35554/g.41146  ORF Transcript_35554/g.41146 Transcript_35554/m.41146 type:complete len:97 (+) Transcript_35554:228-518(+)